MYRTAYIIFIRRSMVSSTEDQAQLSYCHITWIINLEEGLQTDVVFMDICKAFDSVHHSKLLKKLHDFGFSGSLLLWFQNYLSGRFQRVTVHGATSTSLSIASGVQQGALLGPFLFTVLLSVHQRFI
jgi:hypothetical protein